jgi:hypothetical protein
MLPFWSFAAAIPGTPAALPGKTVGFTAAAPAVLKNIATFRTTIRSHYACACHSALWESGSARSSFIFFSLFANRPTNG